MNEHRIGEPGARSEKIVEEAGSRSLGRRGINIAMGRQLHQVFVAAGFEPPRMRVDGFAGGSRTFVEAFTVVSAETIRSLLPGSFQHITAISPSARAAPRSTHRGDRGVSDN